MKKQKPSTEALDLQINRLLTLIEEEEPTSNNYVRLVRNLEALYEAKNEKLKSSQDDYEDSHNKAAVWKLVGDVTTTVIGTVGGMLQLLCVIRSEDVCKFLSTKALPFVRHIK